MDSLKRHGNYSTRAIRKHTVPDTRTAILTATSKMPGPSFSLPAGKACPNSHGEICSHCYAQNGCYRYSSTRHAQNVRFAWTVQAMRTPEGMEAWIAAMVTAIEATGARYFRGHDSGDFFNVAYVQAWIAVCKALPEVKFWFPTREYQSKASTLGLEVLNPRMTYLRMLAALPNVTVRPSALSIGQYAPVVSGLHGGSTVNQPDVMRTYQCPAYRQGGHCGECRTCWEEKSLPVSYPLH